MSRPNVLADSLRRVLRSKGWTAEADRFTVTAVEPAFEPVNHCWLAGDASRISTEEVRRIRPSRIIVSDISSTSEVDRLRDAMAQYGRESNIYYFTRFIDELWGASFAAERARMDSRSREPIYGELDADPSADVRHVRRELDLGEAIVEDHWLFERYLSQEGASLAILSDAGQGKSELLQWMEWRYVTRYESLAMQRSPGLPPIALRVPLRGLRSLSVDSIAQYLMAGDSLLGLPGLPRISSGSFLLELIRLNRILLLLDGVDELQITTEQLDRDLRDLSKAVLDGARVVVSARRGHLATDTGMRNFRPGAMANLLPMSLEASRQLILKNQGSESEADVVCRVIAGTAAAGNPLYLLMALWSKTHDLRDIGNTIESKTIILKSLVERFCERDERRLAIPTIVQLGLLKSLSHWILIEKSLTVQAALELLGIDPSDSESAMLTAPHAFISLQPSGEFTADEPLVNFKYPEFEALFLAMALSDDWNDLGFQSLTEEFRSRKLSEAVTEFMARLLEMDKIREAWQAASSIRAPLIRRNLLGIALAVVEDLDASGSTVERAKLLSEILGSKDLSRVNLSGLQLSRLDLTGWNLENIDGRGGALLYCDNLQRAKIDASINSLDSLDGSELEAPIDRSARRATGLRVLAQSLQCVSIPGRVGLRPRVAVNDAKPSASWRILNKRGWCTSRREEHGTAFFRLSPDGARHFAELQSKMVTSEALALAYVMKSEALTHLVEELGAE